MKYLSVFFILFLFSCQQNRFYVNVENEGDSELNNYPVTISWDKLPEKIKNGDFVIKKNDSIISFQIDDIDNDGNPDEIFLLLDLNPHEKVKLEFISDQKNEKNKVERVANVRFGEVNPPYREISSFKRVTAKDPVTSTQLFLMEGIGWENDNVAFRNYYDQRNGMDIFGKRVSDMVLDSVGIQGTNYHKLADWGMDILHVGSSLGAGAIAFEINDTIYPIRNLDDSYYHLISDGPLRAMFKLEHKNVKISDRKYNIDQIISIYGGTYFYTDKVVVEGLKGDEKLVTGIVNLHSDSLYIDDSNNKFINYYTHSVQAMDTTYLGMGVMVANDLHPEVLPEDIKTKGIEATYFIAMEFDKNNTASYRFYSGWERTDKNFKNRKYFAELMKSDADLFSTPIKIR